MLFLTFLRKSIPLIFSLLSFCTTIVAQKAIEGKVVDNNQQPLSGATVALKGTKLTTATDLYGNFKINANENDKLVISYVGYTDLEIEASQARSIVLAPDSKNMSEVVVTALGVKKQTKRLGYAVQEVKGSELVKAREPNPVNGLVGKVSGLTVGISPELLGRPQLLLRGTSITLFIIDGIPINSDTWNISSDDIESITVLKGPTASALYGYRGQNGAIVITTKRGSKDKRGYSVEVNNSTMFENGFIAIPRVQDEYGPGDHGKYSFVDGRGGGLNDGDYDIWGPKFEGQNISQYDSPIDPVTGQRIPTPWTNRGKDNLERFIQTGLLTTTNIAVSAKGEKYDLRFSTSHSYQKGIVPNTDLNIINFNTTLGYNFTNKLRFETNINYNRQFTENFPDVNYGPNSMIYNIIIWGGADWSINDMQNYWQPGKEGVQQIYAEYQRYNNPWFMAKEWLRGHYKNDVYGYASLNYKFNKNLEVIGRTAITTYNLYRPERFPYSATVYGREEAKGDYREDRRELFENNTEVMFKYNYDVLKNINLTGFVGGNIRSFKYNSNYTTTDYLNVPGVFSFANSRNPIKAYSFNSNMIVLSGYYSLDLTFNKYFTVSTTGRVDKLSSLPEQNRTYFYPSASASTVLSDYIPLPKAISFLKLRASYANVKSGGFSTASTIGPTPNAPYPLGYGSVYQSSYDGPTYGLAQVYSTPLIYNNTPAAYYTNTLFDPELKPDSRSSIEGGLDIRFFNNRLAFDASYFEYINGPGIFTKELSQTTGYTGYVLNAVKTRTKGFELTLSGTAIKQKDFNWDVTVNWSTYRERYDELPEGQPTIYTFYKKGDRADGFYSSAFVRTPDGQIINDAGGRPIIYPVAQFLGNANPDWVWGVNNKFNWKDLSFSFLFDGRVGGVMENYIRRQTFRGGRHIETVEGAMGDARYQDYKGVKSYVGEGVVVSNGTPITYDPVTGLVTNYKDLQFAPNTTKTYLQDYISRYNSQTEGNLMSKTFAKLREVIIGYTLPSSVLGKSFIKKIEVSLVGRNLLYFVKDEKHKDVDIDKYAGRQTSTDLQTPTTRRYGFNLNLIF
jgi:TonB-linked SusC/RagA family outer membrane protein